MSDETTPPPGEPMPPAPDAPMPPAPAPAYPSGAAPQNGMGTVGLVMAILQFLCLGPIGSVLAVIFGRIGMNRAKRGEATNGGVATAAFWLGIVGLILTVIGTVLAVVLFGFGVKAVSEGVDPAKNSQTGLIDGNYEMNPNTSLRLNENCAFGGTAVDVDTGDASESSVTVVGQGSRECGSDSGTPDAVQFEVSGGVARIVGIG